MLLCTIAGISLILAVLRTLGNPAWVLPLYFVLSYAELFILALAFLFVLCKLVDLDKPQEKDSPFYRWAMYLYVDALVTLFKVKIHAVGLEKIPQSLEEAIAVAKDSPFLKEYLPERILSIYCRE